MVRTPDTDPASALGFAMSNAPNLTPEMIAAALSVSGVSAEHTGIDYPVEVVIEQ